MPHARAQAQERLGQLGRAQVLGGRGVRPVGLRVFDQVAVETLAVADRRLERDRVFDELEQRADALGREAALLRDLGQQRLAVELLRQLAAGAHHAPHLLGDVDGQPDRPSLVGERARDRLADPPGRVGRELVAERVVELLDRPDQAEVALLDQVEQRDAGLGVVARDRHHQAQVRLDQLLLGRLVALVLQARELAFLGGRQQRPVADLADVELERVGRLRLRRLALDRLGLLDLVDRLRNDLEPRLGMPGLGERFWERPLLHYAGCIGSPPPPLEGRVHPHEGSRMHV